MFDSHSYHHTTRVTQQPNDAADAARLYGELKEKTEKEILQVARTAPNDFQCVLHQNEHYATGLTTLKAFYTLNGQSLSDEVEYDKYSMKAQGLDEVYGGVSLLHKKMAERIASEMLMSGMKTLERRLQAY